MNLKSQIHRINCFPYRHFERSEKSSLHSALSCSFRRRIPLPCYHTYGAIPVCKKDPSASLGMTLRKRRFPNIPFIRDVGYPSPRYRHFERSREIFLALCSFLLHSHKVSPLQLSHIRRYTCVQERSLDFARDDVTGIVLSKYIRWTLREINPFPHTVISSAARNLPCTLLFLAPFAKVSPFPLSHIGRYTGVPERSLDFARDDDTGIAFSQHILYTMRRISPYDPQQKSPGKSRSFFVSERLICQTVRAWCLLLLQYQ